MMLLKTFANCYVFEHLTSPIIFGGMGSIIGPIIGAYLLTLVNESLRFMGEFRLLIYSSAVVLVILFAPKGLLDLITRGFRNVLGH